MIETISTIREIYAQVRDFDLVITNDAPLCTALNSLIETPRLGPFAVTPHALARRFAPRLFGKPLQDIGAVVLKGARQLDMPLKQAHYHIERVNAIHEHTGQLQQVRPFLEPGPEGRTQQILDYLAATPTVYNAMESFDWQQAGLADKRTAVIGPELFGQLDRRVLPRDYVSVPLPTGPKEWPLPAFHLFSTEKDIVDRIAEMVTTDNADDIAVVLNISSNYLALLKARFESRNIPVRDKDLLGDNLLVRSFLSLIDTGLRGSGLLVRDIMPLAGLCGAPIRSEVRNHALEAFSAASEDPAFRKFHDLFIALPDIHCGDLIERLRTMGWDMPDILPELLDHLGFSGKPPTRQMWHELNYYLEHFETELARCKRGVLFVNCRNAAFINRPVCIFAGLDESWTRHAENYPWVDAPAEEERHLQRFQALLQQGDQQFYFSPLLRHNTPVIPCYYFNLLYDRRIEGFHDPLFRGRPVVNPGTAPSPAASPPAGGGTAAETIEELSPSSLNRFLLCPKYYAYSRLAEQEDQEYLLKGNLLHEFAAFYAAHPAAAEAKGLDFFIDAMLEQYQVLAPGNIPELDHTFFKIASDNLRQFLQGLEVQPVSDLETIRQSRPDRNTFSALLKKPINADHIECAFSDAVRHLRGIIDLAAGPDHIIDYKTGRSKRSATEIIRQALPAVRANQVDVQPLLYLAAWRAINPGPLQFQYFYCLANHRDIIEQREDPADNSITIHYIPHTFNEYLAAEPQVLGAASQGRQAFMEKAGMDVFRTFFKAHPLPVELQFDRAALLAASLHTALEEAVTSALGKTNKTIVRNVEGVLKAAVDLRTGTRCEPHFFREDLDEFETIVTDALTRINGGLQDRFPFDPLTPDTCRDCEAASYCLRGQK